MMSLDIRERFLTHIFPVTESGCWIWMAGVYGPGYGKFYFMGHDQGAHRVAWKLFRGPIPDGMCVLHRCDVRSCVNPNHLFLGTKKENAMDMVSKGRSGAKYWDVCAKGHSNWRKTTKRRVCVTCISERSKVSRCTPEYRTQHAAAERQRRQRCRAS